MAITFNAIGIWLLKIMAAIIMLQTLYFKFSGSKESIYIFSELGMEPYGRIGIGILELIASVLILVPRTSVFGALIAVGLMAGALFSHLTTLGVVIMGDGGLLFFYALLVFFSSLAIIFIYRQQLYHLFRINAKLRL